MRNPTAPILTICLVSVWSSLIGIPNNYAQEVMSNKDVISLVEAGLDAEIIIAKIKAGTPAFETSAEALKALNAAGVPKSVIVVMIEEAGRSAKSNAAAAKDDEKLLSSVPEQGNLRDLFTRGKIYIATEDLKARDRIEKELVNVKRFTIVDRIESADIVIKYESWTETVNVTATVVGNTATARENKQLVGLLTIMVGSEDSDNGRRRLVYSARKTKYFVWEANPAESTTKQFIKDLTKAAALGPKR